MFFFRDHKLNFDKSLIYMLEDILTKEIYETNQSFNLGKFSYGFAPTKFDLLSLPFRNQLSLKTFALYFGSWGDTEKEAFQNLNQMFEVLNNAIKKTSDSIKAFISK